MASGSFKDTSKAINGVFATHIHVQDLPKEAQEAIDAYIEKHQERDDHDTQRLQEELINIHSKFVAKAPGNLVVFLQLLKALRPGIASQACLQEWWTLVIQPVIDGLGHSRSEISHSSEFLLSILDYDPEIDKDGDHAKTSSHFAKLLLDAYLKRTRLHDSDNEVLSSEDDFVGQQLGDVLIAYGRKKPKDFMTALDRLFVVKDQRMQALNLLSAFVQSQPPHLWLVLKTPLIEHLLQCLLVDTSTTVISLALTTLIMFLPHIPSSVRAHLPRLFLIYSRLLCWERYRPSSSTDEKNSVIEEEEEDSEDEEAGNLAEPPPVEVWDKLESSFENAESTTPELLHYFTFLYGLYPLNFTSYIRKPRKYLKSINFPRADEFDLDQKIIRLRTEQFSRLHLLHPSFTNTTLEDELTDDRWLKSDPVDVVAECISLCLTTLNPMINTAHTTSVKMPDVPPALVKTEDIPSESLLGYSEDAQLSALDPWISTDNGSIPSWRAILGQIEPHTSLHRAALQGHGTPHSNSPAITSPALSSVRPQGRDDIGDSPTLGAIVTPNLRATSRSRRHGSIVSLHSGIENSPRMAAVQVPARDEMPRSPALRPSGTQGERNLAFLQREVMLLKNDLKFERYLKQQHLMHIGQLQRKQIKEVTVEAETQNLINSNRTLKNKLVEANKAYVLLKKETATNRSQSKKYEVELASKIRSLKEEERQWRTDGETLRADLAKVRSDCNHLRNIVVESEARELLARQEVASGTLKLEQLESLFKRVQELEAKLYVYEARELEFEHSRDEKEILTTELAAANLRLESRDADWERERTANDRRLQDLEVRLQAAQNPTAGGGIPGQLAPQAQHLIDKAVAVNKAKYSALKKEHVRLQHRFLELEIKSKELEQAAADAAIAVNGGNSYGSRHYQSVPFSPFDSNYHNTNTTGTGSGNDGRSGSIYTRHKPIPIPIPTPHSHSHSSSSSSPLGTRTRSSRPANSPSLDNHNANAASSASPSHHHSPLQAAHAHNVNYSNASSASRPLHRTGALSPTGVSGVHPSSPMARSVAGESVRSSRANSSFDSAGGGGSASGGAGSGGGINIVGGRDNREGRENSITTSPFYSNSISAFSQDSLDSIGGEASLQGRKNSGASSKIGTKGDVGGQGRGGGAQSIAKHKDKEDEKRKDKKDKSKPGSLLGFRNIL